MLKTILLTNIYHKWNGLLQDFASFENVLLSEFVLNSEILDMDYKQISEQMSEKLISEMDISSYLIIIIL